MPLNIPALINLILSNCIGSIVRIPLFFLSFSLSLSLSLSLSFLSSNSNLLCDTAYGVQYSKPSKIVECDLVSLAFIQLKLRKIEVCQLTTKDEPHQSRFKTKVKTARGRIHNDAHPSTNRRKHGETKTKEKQNQSK